jgi:Trk-type K+ transport system membrane component
MNSIIFIATVVVSFIVVRIGAIAFHLTGVEWSLAKFQALSCFTGTGFTTREAELITAHPQRRRVASMLMVFGNAGLVTLIATFANSLRPALVPQVSLPLLHLVFPSRYLPLVNLLVLAAAAYLVYRVFTHSRVTSRLTNALRSRIIKRRLVKPVTFEELLIATGGYGVSSTEVGEKSPVMNKTILESALRSHDITILVIERGKDAIPNPPADTKILLGDRVICFGKLLTIRKELCGIGG